MRDPVTMRRITWKTPETHTSYLLSTIVFAKKGQGWGGRGDFTGEDVCVEGKEGEVDCEVGDRGIGFEY
jgi:hypothetical protein